MISSTAGRCCRQTRSCAAHLACLVSLWSWAHLSLHIQAFHPPSSPLNAPLSSAHQRWSSRKHSLIHTSLRSSSSNNPPVETENEPNSSGSPRRRLWLGRRDREQQQTVNNSGNSNPKNNNNNPWVRVLQSFVSLQIRGWARFRSLSKGAKRLFLIQLFVLSAVLGGVVRQNSGPSMPPPIEISYSKFLRLVQAQPSTATTTGTAPDAAAAALPSPPPPPVIDQIRIRSDRINFLLYPQQQPEPSAAASVASAGPTTTTTTTTDKAPRRTLPSFWPYRTTTPKTAISSTASTTESLTTTGTTTTRFSRLFQRQSAATTASTSSEQSTTGLLLDPPQQKLTRKRGLKKKKGVPPPVLRAYTRPVAASPDLLNLLQQHNLPFAAAPKPSPSPAEVLLRFSMISFYFFILWRFYRTLAKASGSGEDKNGGPGKLFGKDDNLTSGGGKAPSFDDIQGMDAAKLEVMELVDTLRHPEKYALWGARAPTGLLLEGPPGTGKTMLARATAATAGVPLLYCSGSDFVEMFVGRGAARVRKLFERAAKMAPCLIFVDELDALGKSRDMGGLGSGLRSSNDEAEQTLNQLLACMDGLDSSQRGICVMAATNRKEVLDPALIRPGRFDRIVSLQLPDWAGRAAILRVHCRKLPGFVEDRSSSADLEPPTRPKAFGRGRLIDLRAVAAATPGLSGAELEFIVNEAAIRAVRRTSLRHSDTEHGLPAPCVEAVDFEASVASFFATRRKSTRPGDFMKSIWN